MFESKLNQSYQKEYILYCYKVITMVSAVAAISLVNNLLSIYNMIFQMAEPLDNQKRGRQFSLSLGINTCPKRGVPYPIKSIIRQAKLNGRGVNHNTTK